MFLYLGPPLSVASIHFCRDCIIFQKVFDNSDRPLHHVYKNTTDGIQIDFYRGP